MSILRNQLKKAQARINEINDTVNTLGATAEEEGRGLNEADNKLIEELTLEVDEIEQQIASLNKAIAIEDRQAHTQLIQTELENERQPAIGGLPKVVTRQRTKYFDSNREAYEMGQWCSALSGNHSARNWCADHSLIRNDGNIGTPADGGYTVPTPLSETIIRLVEQYGVFRRNADVRAMPSNTYDVPKRASGLTVVYPGEATSINASTPQWSQVNLVATKYATRSLWSTELNEDSVVAYADFLAQEVATAFSLAEDTNGFSGDGTSGSGNVTGIDNALNAGATVTLGAGDTAPSAITLDDLQEMVGRVKEYPGLMPMWYMHKSIYYTVVVDLMAGLGGTDMIQYEEGGRKMLLGYPVEFTQVLPTSADASPAGKMFIVFGDLRLGAIMGTRRTLSMRVLNELYAETDQIGMIATSRCDIQVHETGSATEAGALVKLNTAAV